MESYSEAVKQYDKPHNDLNSDKSMCFLQAYVNISFLFIWGQSSIQTDTQ